MSLRLWRIEELEAALLARGCVQATGWDDRYWGRWWSHPIGNRWILVPYPEEPDENGDASNPMNCRYPEFVLDELFAAHDLDPLP